MAATLDAYQLAKLYVGINLLTLSWPGRFWGDQLMMDGVCAEQALHTHGALTRQASRLTSSPLLPEATPAPPAAPTLVRTNVSLIRCGEELCSVPEPLTGGRICYKTMTDRLASLLWAAPPKNFLVMKKWKDSKV